MYVCSLFQIDSGFLYGKPDLVLGCQQPPPCLEVLVTFVRVLWDSARWALEIECLTVGALLFRALWEDFIGPNFLLQQWKNMEDVPQTGASGPWVTRFSNASAGQGPSSCNTHPGLCSLYITQLGSIKRGKLTKENLWLPEKHCRWHDRCSICQNHSCWTPNSPPSMWTSKSFWDQCYGKLPAG